MANPLLPPNPCLLGILLVAKFDSDAKVVFRYPPHPGDDDSTLTKYFARSVGDGTTSSSDEENSSTSEDEDNRSVSDSKLTQDEKPKDPEIDETGSASPEKRDGMTTPQRHRRWDDLFGYSSDLLAKLLCPAASTHKKKFEVALNDIVFLGRPIFAKEDGRWRRRRRKPRTSNGNVDGSLDNSKTKTSLQVAGGLSETSGFETDDRSQMRPSVDPVNQTQDGASDQPPKQDTIEGSLTPKVKDDLTMFHTVFILNPPPLEYHVRIKEMYDHVVKKFSRAMKWEQARSSYVSEEAKVIAGSTKGYFKSTKSLGPDPPMAPLYHEILSQSSLARGIANVYSGISSSQIAHITSTPTLSLSLQIPLPRSISVLPSLISPPLPGLWLTTATTIPIDDDAHISSSQLASHFGLLLLSDLNTILTDVNSTDSPLTAPLVHYLRVSKPTKSFYQISQSSGIALSDIQFLASHLIYWRRARAIPPLHQRDIYIVSPNTDMSKLAAATHTFAKIFPTFPALPKILGMLSSAPRPYSTLIPSRDHKEGYMDILAWLFCGGWVTQLRTFAWTRVLPHLVRAVEKGAEPEKQPRKPTAKADVQEYILDGPHSASPPISSTHSSTHTTLPFVPSSPLPSSVLISRPNHPTSDSSRYLTAISDYIMEEQGAETQKAWNDCVKYFDGKHALETIAVREGWKRKRVGELINGWESMGVLRKARHW